MFYKAISVVIKIFLVFIVLVVLLWLMFSIVLFIDNGYLGGRDTIASFNHGRFQLIEFDTSDIRLIGLYDAKAEKVIENNIYFWRNVDDKVYFIIKDGYGVLQLTNDNYKKSSNLTDFDIEDQYILGGLYIMKE